MDANPCHGILDPGTRCGGQARTEWHAVGAGNALREALGLPGRRGEHDSIPLNASSFAECQRDEFEAEQCGGDNASKSPPDGKDLPEYTPRGPVPAVAVGIPGRSVSLIASPAGTKVIAASNDRQQRISLESGDTREVLDGLEVSASAPQPAFTDLAYRVRWDDGSVLRVDTSRWGLRTSFSPSASARDANPRGLLGNFNGDPDDDLTRPDGVRVPVDATDAVLRADFGDPWRITQSDSVFAYGPGESTDTFTNLSFPSSQLEISPGADAAARAVCAAAGVPGGDMLDGCVFDVVATGNPELADIAAQVSLGLRTSALRDGSKVSGAITSPAKVDAYDLDLGDATAFYVADWRDGASCDQSLIVSVVPGTRSAACDGLTTRFRLDDQGPHRLEIATSSGSVSAYSFTVVTVKPRTLPITLGQPVHGVLDVPGREDIYQLPAGLTSLSIDTDLTCGTDAANLWLSTADLTVGESSGGGIPLCGGRVTLAQSFEPSHRYGLRVSNSALQTGSYRFTAG